MSYNTIVRLSALGKSQLMYLFKNEGHRMSYYTIVRLSALGKERQSKLSANNYIPR